MRRFLLTTHAFIFLSVTLSLTIINGSGARNLDKVELTKYDTLRNTSSSLALVENGSSVIEFATPSKVRLCELVTLLPYTTATESNSARELVLEDAAAILLAIHLFNKGESNRVISHPNHVENFNHISLNECNIRFTASFFNTESSAISSTKRLTDLLKNEHSPSTPFPVSVIGPYASKVTSPTAILTGIQDIPHISHSASSTDFDNQEQYPLFGRMCANSIGDAEAITSYLSEVLNVTHFGMIFVTDSFGSSQAKAVQDAAGSRGIIIDSVSISSEQHADSEEIKRAVTHLKKTKLRYFLGIFMEEHYDFVMSQAIEEEIVGDDYVWLLSGVDLAEFEKKAKYPAGK